MQKFLHISERAVKTFCKAKFYILPDGSRRLAQISRFNAPVFCPPGYESCKQVFDNLEQAFDHADNEQMFVDEEEAAAIAEANTRRAKRRAQKNAFDIIMCNPDLDTFCTFTYSPEVVSDKSDYNECYKYLATWLGNRVQRRGLKYVCVAELTKRGDVHFHALMNSSALKNSLERAISPNGHALTHGKKPLYNLKDWRAGFSSCELLGTDASDREKVAKYIFKYMSKVEDGKIGGRYALIGGEVSRPVYAYADTPDELGDLGAAVYSREVNIDGIVYTEWSFI